MTEHRHEWYLDVRYDDAIRGRCKTAGCCEELGENEILHRLNATEVLSAEDARDLLDFVWSHLSNSEVESMLRNYARILLGEDDETE